MVELMYKGRAVSKLTQDAKKKDWHEFTKCPCENLANPESPCSPLGYVHVCQGISIGNAWRKQFARAADEIMRQELARAAL